MAYLLFFNINFVLSFVCWLEPAPGPIKKTEFFSFIINFFKDFRSVITSFKDEGNFEEYIGKVFFEHLRQLLKQLPHLKL